MAEETPRAAQLLHDTLCQTLGGAVLLVGVLASRLKAGRTVELAEIEELEAVLARAVEEARTALQQLQSAVKSGRPPAR